jgi:hypothetical protein
MRYDTRSTVRCAVKLANQHTYAPKNNSRGSVSIVPHMRAAAALPELSSRSEKWWGEAAHYCAVAS